MASASITRAAPVRASASDVAAAVVSVTPGGRADHRGVGMLGGLLQLQVGVEGPQHHRLQVGGVDGQRRLGGAEQRHQARADAAGPRARRQPRRAGAPDLAADHDQPAAGVLVAWSAAGQGKRRARAPARSRTGWRRGGAQADVGDRPPRRTGCGRAPARGPACWRGR